MFYEKLNNELKKHDLNLSQLANAIGINQSGTSRYKKGGYPSIEALKKICKYLNVSADYLLDLDDGAPLINLTDQEQELLKHFRSCSPGEQESILLLAQAGAAKAEKEETLSNLKNIG